MQNVGTMVDLYQQGDVMNETEPTGLQRAPEGTHAKIDRSATDLCQCGKTTVAGCRNPFSTCVETQYSHAPDRVNEFRQALERVGALVCDCGRTTVVGCIAADGKKCGHAPDPVIERQALERVGADDAET